MFDPIKVVDIELSRPITTVAKLEDYIALKGLIRLYGTPLGYIQLPVVNGRCTAEALSQAILEAYGWDIARKHLRDLLAASLPADDWNLTNLFDVTPSINNLALPLVTVAVCTRNRTGDLSLCLDALLKLDYPHLDLLVVDNAPSDDSTERLVKDKYPSARYVQESRPGLDWARNRAAIEARGEIIAYTDDDVIVDPGWVTAIAEVFVENPDVMVVTGLVVPYELETKAQILFEIYGGFGRGFEQKQFRLDPEEKQRWPYFGTGQYGTGANMAYRRTLFDQIGYFDPALDVGTVTNGGGELEMFFRVLKEGYTLAYEPAAIVHHRHRRDDNELRKQLVNNSIGLYSYFVCSFLNYPNERFMFIRLGLWWFWWQYVRRLLKSIVAPNITISRDLAWAELWGCVVGLTRYQKACIAVNEITKNYGSQLEETNVSSQCLTQTTSSKHPFAVAVRNIDLNKALTGINDIDDYKYVRIYVTCNQYMLGSFDIENSYRPISASRLRKSIVDHFGVRLLNIEHKFSDDFVWNKAVAAISERYLQTKNSDYTLEDLHLPNNVAVSIVVATLDRPDDLRNCLRHLMAQESSRPVEIIVVDNNPSSGLTPPVIAEFPDVVLINEARKGLAYARNAGFVASTGEIAIATDDDVTAPPNWLEKLVTPFARSDVMIVTGNVLPIELENTAQHLFEHYGGLGRGLESFEVNGAWFESFDRYAVPTWELGATANAAFRTTIFDDPQIGLMNEALGPGMPSGVGEDTYLFYRTLKAGYTLVYEPDAFVWHKHRRTMSALRRQIFSYSTGHIAYHLTTLLHDRDLRSLMHILYHLPMWRITSIVSAIKNKLLGRQNDYPLSFILFEIAGNLAGPWKLWQSHRRVKREGRSGPYLPVSQRQKFVNNLRGEVIKIQQRPIIYNTDKV